MVVAEPMEASQNSAPNASAGAMNDQHQEDDSVIRCVCGQNVDKGVMVQCETCEVWQHLNCNGYKEIGQAPENYFCELCDPRPVHCVCGQTGTTAQVKGPFGKMLKCKSCKNWLHMKCLGVSDRSIPKKFVCPICTEVKIPEMAQKTARKTKNSLKSDKHAFDFISSAKLRHELRADQQTVGPDSDIHEVLTKYVRLYADFSTETSSQDLVRAMSILLCLESSAIFEQVRDTTDALILATYKKQDPFHFNKAYKNGEASHSSKLDKLGVGKVVFKEKKKDTESTDGTPSAKTRWSTVVQQPHSENDCIADFSETITTPLDATTSDAKLYEILWNSSLPQPDSESASESAEDRSCPQLLTTLKLIRRSCSPSVSVKIIGKPSSKPGAKSESDSKANDVEDSKTPNSPNKSTEDSNSDKAATSITDSPKGEDVDAKNSAEDKSEHKTKRVKVSEADEDSAPSTANGSVDSDSNVHTQLVCLSDIAKSGEVTIPFEFPWKLLNQRIECACLDSAKKCNVSKWFLRRRRHLIKLSEELSVGLTSMPPLTPKESFAVPEPPEPVPKPSADGAIPPTPSSPRKKKIARELDSPIVYPEDNSAKLSREERKLKYIMKTFDKLQNRDSKKKKPDGEEGTPDAEGAPEAPRKGGPGRSKKRVKVKKDGEKSDDDGSQPQEGKSSDATAPSTPTPKRRKRRGPGKKISASQTSVQFEGSVDSPHANQNSKSDDGNEMSSCASSATGNSAALQPDFCKFGRKAWFKFHQQSSSRFTSSSSSSYINLNGAVSAAVPFRKWLFHNANNNQFQVSRS